MKEENIEGIIKNHLKILVDAKERRCGAGELRKITEEITEVIKLITELVCLGS